MLFYEFKQPRVADSLKLKSAYGNKKLVTADNVKSLEGLGEQRKVIRSTLIQITDPKAQGNAND